MTITLLHGDCLDMLGSLASGSVQALITSPPYYGLRQYSIPPSHWPAVEYTPLIGLPPVVIPPMVCQLGAEPDPLSYIGHLVHVSRLARPALRKDGTLWCALGDSYAQDTKWGGASGGKNYMSAAGDLPRDRRATGVPDKNLLGIPARAALALQAGGWVWRSEIIWDKPNPMPESVRDRVTRSHEQILMFGNSARYYYDADAVAEPISDVSLARISQPNFAEQTGGDRDYAKNGVNPNRSARKTLENFAKNGSGTRNKRSVWRIATTPMPARLRNGDEAHYAAWPLALVDVMIRASSANRACSACGAAWVRQVEREAQYEKRQQRGQPNGSPPQVDSTGWKPAKITDIGHAPACQCDAPTARCVILDPFAGTGTTGAVAESLGRDSILIDLGYQTLQARRTDGVQIGMEAYL